MLYTQDFDRIPSLQKRDFLCEKDFQNLKPFDIVRESQDLEILESPEFKDWSSFDNFLIFGTGGSSLGGRTLHSISKPKKNIKFVSNLDPTSLRELYDTTDPKSTGFLFISKSGGTLEVITQLLLTMEFAKRSNIVSDHFAVITENKPSSLLEVADAFAFLCLDHPKEIGGRYSVFSLAGMVPAVLCGLDPFEIRKGGRQILEDFNNNTSSIGNGVDFLLEHLGKGISNHISFIYSEKLISFGHWLAQLYAESSGKLGKGITPLTAIGSADQHSQLQLYLDGPKDKCFTLFYEKQKARYVIDHALLCYDYTFLNGKTVADIFKSQYEATKQVLTEKGYNVRTIEIPPINEKVMGGLFMHFMLETACVCKAMGVNPFDQPAVEQGKTLANNLLRAKGNYCEDYFRKNASVRK